LRTPAQQIDNPYPYIAKRLYPTPTPVHVGVDDAVARAENRLEIITGIPRTGIGIGWIDQDLALQQTLMFLDDSLECEQTRE
jgi:hypothetical protein